MREYQIDLENIWTQNQRHCGLLYALELVLFE